MSVFGSSHTWKHIINKCIFIYRLCLCNSTLQARFHNDLNQSIHPAGRQMPVSSYSLALILYKPTKKKQNVCETTWGFFYARVLKLQLKHNDNCGLVWCECCFCVSTANEYYGFWKVDDNWSYSLQFTHHIHFIIHVQARRFKNNAHFKFIHRHILMLNGCRSQIITVRVNFLVV